MKPPDDNEDEDIKLKILESSANVVMGGFSFLTWIQIVLSLTVVSGIVGGICFGLFGQTSWAGVLWIGWITAGAVSGVACAENIRKKTGLIKFASKRFSSPDLDRKPETDEK